MKERVIKINNLLADRGAGFQAEYRLVWHDNAEKEGYVLRGRERNCSPVIYRGAWFEKTDEEVADYLCLAYSEYAMMLDMHGFTDPVEVLKRILPRVSSADNREAMQRADIFFTEDVEGLLTSLYLPVELTDEYEGCIQLTNTLIDTIGLYPDEAASAALRNMSEAADVLSMEDMLSEITGAGTGDGPTGMPVLTVVTNKARYFGAAAILCPEVYERLRQRSGHGRLIMLPSSVHEVLVTEIGEDADLSAFRRMVRDVNDKEVRPEERLSYSVFGWKDGSLCAIA